MQGPGRGSEGEGAMVGRRGAGRAGRAAENFSEAARGPYRRGTHPGGPTGGYELVRVGGRFFILRAGACACAGRGGAGAR